MNRRLRFGAGLALVLLFLHGSRLLAQLGVYANVSVSKMTNLDGTTFIYGPTVGVNKQLADHNGFRIGGDLRGSFQGGGGLRLAQVSVGPKFSYTRRALTPYVEFLVGYGRLRTTRGTTQNSSTDSLIQLNGGVDYQVNDHIDWRTFEYGYEQYYGVGGAFNPKTFSTGIVYNFEPRRKTSK